MPSPGRPRRYPYVCRHRSTRGRCVPRARRRGSIRRRGVGGFPGGNSTRSRYPARGRCDARRSPTRRRTDPSSRHSPRHRRHRFFGTRGVSWRSRVWRLATGKKRRRRSRRWSGETLCAPTTGRSDARTSREDFCAVIEGDSKDEPRTHGADDGRADLFVVGYEYERSTFVLDSHTFVSATVPLYWRL